MRKFTAIFVALLFLCGLTVAQERLSESQQDAQNAMSVEMSPNLKFQSPGAVDAPFDMQLNFDLEIATGALGNAGSEFDGNEFFTTRWASTSFTVSIPPATCWKNSQSAG